MIPTLVTCPALFDALARRAAQRQAWRAELILLLGLREADAGDIVTALGRIASAVTLREEQVVEACLKEIRAGAKSGEALARVQMALEGPSYTREGRFGTAREAPDAGVPVRPR